MKFLQINMIVLILICLFFTPASLIALEDQSKFTKENKLLITNLSGIAILTTWGFVSWEYGERSPHGKSEYWFAQDTEEGGADKLAHLYASYLASHCFSALCESWGYGIEKASAYGALSSFGLMSFIEFGDSFSNYGFSYEDFIMNTIGCYAGYLLYKYPEYSKKIDLRVEYKPNFQAKDFSTDYENMKFLVAFKMDGFDSVQNKYLKYLEYHIGYYARGYDGDHLDKSRNLYVGLGINISRIFSNLSFTKTSKIFNYYQVPYTYAQVKKRLPR